MNESVDSDKIGDLSSWSVTEESTPHIIGGSRGSTGSASFTGEVEEDSSFLINDSIVLHSESLGDVTGRVTSATVNDISVTGNSGTLLGGLNVERNAPPISFGVRYNQLPIGSSSSVMTFDRTTNVLHAGPPAGSPNIFGAYDENRNLLYTWLSYGTTAGTIATSGLIDMAIDNAGNFYVLDGANVSKFNSARVYQTRWAVTGGKAITAAANGSIYVVRYATSAGPVVNIYTNTGTLTGSWTISSNSIVSSLDEYSVVSDSMSNVYVAGREYSLSGIFKFNAAGLFIARIAQYPLGITNSILRAVDMSIDADDRIFVLASAAGSSELFCFDTEGNVINYLEADATYLPPDGSNGPMNFFRSIEAATDGYFFLAPQNSASPASAQVYTGIYPRLSMAIQVYLNLVFPGIEYVYGASSDPEIILPGWNTDVWTKLNDLCAAYNIEIASVNSQIVVRDVGSITKEFSDTSASSVPTVTVGNGSARNVKITAQNPVTATEGYSSVTNLVNNPALAVDATGWSGYAGAGTTTPVVTQGRSTLNPPPYGAASYRMQWTAGTTSFAPNAYIRYRMDVPLSNTVNVTFSSFVRSSRSTVLMLRVTYYDAANVSLGVASSQTFLVAANIWTRMWTDVPFLTPAAGIIAYATLEVTPVRGVTGFAEYTVGDTLQAGGMMFTVTPDSNIPPYFDGNSANSVWNGAPNASSSTRSVGELFEIYNAETDDNKIFSVEAAQTVVVSVPTNSYPTYIRQPVAVNGFPVAVGQYTVSGKDNLPVIASQWRAYGGSVTISADQDSPGTLTVTLVGPTTAIPGVPGPYRLVVSDGANDYAQLRVSGSGVRTFPEDIQMSTAADPEIVTQEQAPDVNNFAIKDLAMAYDRGIWAADYAGGPTVSITFSVPIEEIDGFGLTAGAVFYMAKTKFRIDSVSISKDNASISATRRITAGEVVALWAGKTAGDAVTFWAGHPAEDRIIKPLSI